MKRFLSLVVFVTALFILERCFTFAETFTEGVRVSPDTVTLKPGEYVWEPERAPEGPLLIVASITEQVAYVYRNGIRIARSSVSTGRPGHRTPTGVFTILEKEVHHTSSIYKGAEMPYMERVTWGGIALHAGDLPGYPDSHGCVRLPLEFSKLLFGVTMKGATVIIADTHSAPATTVHPGLFFSRTGQESEPIGGGQFDWDPDKSPSGPVSLIVSSADKTVYVYRNGVEIGRAGIPNAQVVSPLNDRVFSALQGTDAQEHVRWIEVTVAGTEGASESLFLTAQKSGLPSGFVAKAKTIIAPGTTIIFTNRPVDPTTQSPPNFQILVAQKDKPSVKTE
ncbi:MAG TPA: L,D-transpeptidase [Candidatus Udaeobacter sp.]|nr:L,D-transpeptidase [Candidatus Udaeobacter sp.]